MNDSSKVRIHFKLEQDDDGYPPATVETLWGTPTDNGTFVIDSIPFFVKGIAAGDEVTVTREENRLCFNERTKISDHSTIRIVFYQPAQIPQIRQTIEGFGCQSEWCDGYKLAAIDVPGKADYEKVSEYLRALAEREVVDYEESALRH
jgi:hypothetical protein